MPTEVPPGAPPPIVGKQKVPVQEIPLITKIKGESAGFCDAFKQTPENYREPPTFPEPVPAIPPGPAPPTVPALPSPAPEGPGQVYPSDREIGCAAELGDWTVPSKVQFYSGTSSERPKNSVASDLDDYYGRSAILTLWLKATKPVSLLSIEVDLVRVSKTSETSVFQWTYDATGSATGTATGTSAESSAPLDPETGLPTIVLQNQSIPVTLRTGPCNNRDCGTTGPINAGDLEFKEGAVLGLRINTIRTVSQNLSETDRHAAEVGTDVLLEFGSRDRLSSVSIALDASSEYANSNFAGFFLDDASAFSFKAPSKAKDARTIEINWMTRANAEGDHVLESDNVTLAAGLSDASYILTGNALVGLFWRHTDDIEVRTSSASKDRHAGVQVATPKIKVEVSLVVGGLVVGNNVGALQPHHNSCAGAGCDTPQARTKFFLSLPTSGVELSKGASVRLVARFFGAYACESTTCTPKPQVHAPLIYYGGSADALNGEKPFQWFTPSGIVIPAIDKDSVLASTKKEGLPNGGVGVSNGTFSMEADRVIARVAAGAQAAFALTVKSRDPDFADYELRLDGLPKGHKNFASGFTGLLYPGSYATAGLAVAVPATAGIGSFELKLNGTFTTTTTDSDGNPVVIVTNVGPLVLTVVVDEPFFPPGSAQKRTLRGTAGTDLTTGILDTTDRVKVIGRPHKEAPGFEGALVMVGLMFGAWGLRRRKA